MVRVIVSMFGRETPVELDLDQVEISIVNAPRVIWDGRFAGARGRSDAPLSVHYHIFINGGALQWHRK